MISFQSRDAIIGNIKREPCVISADQFKKIIDEVSYKNRFDILEEIATSLGYYLYHLDVDKVLNILTTGIEDKYKL